MQNARHIIDVRVIFDDVRFGIDVRDQRNERGWTQDELAVIVGYKDGASISQLECANRSEAITIRRYMQICATLGMNPMHYWDCEAPSDGYRSDENGA